ncbi:NAD(P)/FAD-dependent oxidoreductase [Haloarcula salina]|uniref:NAD(P)/FAD-dependent oxidoreductase n=1 Tax=Haloarcula salina TaxID=1429914 RepID=A0AA41G3B3_9EURY|nr:NAD(P)/FAD-dependent oxidoreductase [Haloarcula salina]MBV0903553.1 NAD(P)/FAD-dependent oxidoreductase [Haloarcula salina]
MAGTNGRADGAFDYDVAVVGGGPAGCSAGVFTAREGLETVVFDRGRSSLKRCAHLENYLGFPAGIDVETLYDLFHAHAETAGCALVSDMVESVDRTDESGFALDLQEGEPVTARRVVAATRYDGTYLQGLDGEAMIETNEHHGEEHERFARDYADRDGSTPVDGLYVASPTPGADRQAILAAARGARAGRRVVADARRDDGWWEGVAEGVDWVRREAELDDEWTDRERWVTWFDERHAADAPVDPDSERFQRVRDATVEQARSAYIDPEEIEARAERGHEALAAHLDAESAVDGVGERALLEAMDDDAIRSYVEADETPDGDGL